MLIPEPWEDRAGRNDDSDFLRYLSMVGFDHFLLCPSEESKMEALNILTGKSNFFLFKKSRKGANRRIRRKELGREERKKVFVFCARQKRAK